MHIPRDLRDLIPLLRDAVEKAPPIAEMERKGARLTKTVDHGTYLVKYEYTPWRDVYDTCIYKRGERETAVACTRRLHNGNRSLVLARYKGREIYSPSEIIEVSNPESRRMTYYRVIWGWNPSKHL